MREESPGNGLSANVGAAIVCRDGNDSGNNLPDLCFAIVVRDVWGVKAPMAIHTYTGTPERTARHWSSGAGDSTAQIVIGLIRSVEGYRLLSRIMRDDPPDWWRNMQRLLALAAIAEEFFERMTTTK
jgi:hypothetical protein